jgi:hypothetical protein
MHIESRLAFILLFTISCSQGQPVGNNPGDASPETSDGGANTTPADAMPLASPEAGAEGGITSPDGDAGAANALAGKLAFPVAFSVMYPNEAASQCHANVLPDGSLDATSVLLTSLDVSALLCSNATSSSLTAAITVIDIEIAALGYGSNPVNAVALAPGVFPIGNENVPDDDLCMLDVKPGALVDVRTEQPEAGAAVTVAQGLSGIVTLTSVSPTSIAGSFTATMIDLDPVSGASIPNSESPLAGTFDTTLCPSAAP